jgi:hypothetical protein
VINLDEDAEDGRVIALQSLSNAQLIQILQSLPRRCRWPVDGKR